MDARARVVGVGGEGEASARRGRDVGWPEGGEHRGREDGGGGACRASKGGEETEGEGGRSGAPARGPGADGREREGASATALSGCCRHGGAGGAAEDLRRGDKICWRLYGPCDGDVGRNGRWCKCNRLMPNSPSQASGH